MANIQGFCRDEFLGVREALPEFAAAGNSFDIVLAAYDSLAAAD